MKLPEKPPGFVQLLKNIQDKPDKLEKILSKCFIEAYGKQEKYYHWSKIRHLDPPTGLNHEEWWLGLKMQRMPSKDFLPLKDENGEYFNYNKSQDFIQKSLHEIDKNLGGDMVTEKNLSASPQEKDRYIVSSLVEEAITSSQLEGAATTRKVAREMIRTNRKPANKDEKMIINNFITMKYIKKKTGLKLTPELLKDIHSRITSEILDDKTEEGRFRKKGEDVKIILHDTGQVLYSPPQAKNLDARIQAMCDFANENTPSGFIHPVIRGIILHFWLAYEHPFVDGNGRVARALFYWYMLKSGYSLFEYISISEIIRKSYGQYRDAFLFSETDDNDLTYFIHYHVKVIMKAVEALSKYIEKQKKEYRLLEKEIRNAPINYRQKDLLVHAWKNRDTLYSIKGHMNSHDIAYATARADLLELVKFGLLEKRKVKKQLLFTTVKDFENALKNLRHL